MIAFCENKVNKNNKNLRKLDEDYRFVLYKSMEEVEKADWDQVLSGRNFYLSTDYLGLIERLHKPAIIHLYAMVYKGSEPVFISCFQLIDFTVDVFGDLVASQINSSREKRMKLFDRYIDKYKDQVIMRLLTNGNNFISGEHGFAHLKEISREQAFYLLPKICRAIASEIKLPGAISVTLVKDFYPGLLPPNNQLAANKYVRFNVEPNMLLEVPEYCNSLQDYIALFSKKYRNRAKHIFKDGALVVKKDLNTEEVKAHSKEIDALYEHVFNKARFKLVKLASGYFHEMKRNFPGVFFVTGYFLQDSDKLLAFDSGFNFPGIGIEAHCIGLDYEANKIYELYQNILYNYIERAITAKIRHVNLGRTASEIKSTVGAKANELVCYLKPQNTLSKMVLNPFMGFLQPAEWIPRNPFKEE